MAKIIDSTVFKNPNSVTEQPIDKTTRTVRRIVAEEAQQRQDKMARLRKTRLEREASTPKKTAVTGHKKAPRKPASSAT